MQGKRGGKAKGAHAAGDLRLQIGDFRTEAPELAHSASCAFCRKPQSFALPAGVARYSATKSELVAQTLWF